MTEIISSKRKAYYMNPKFYVYYEIADSDGERRLLINENKKFATIYEDDEKYSKYHGIPMKFNDALPSDEVLTKFLDDFNIWRREAIFAQTYKVDFTIGDVCACQRTFFNLVENYDGTQNINAIEFSYFERCKNNALMFLVEDNIELECVSYDRKMCYANILGSKIKIPTCAGTETTLKKLPKLNKVKCGFYRVKVTTDNKDFYKCFNVSNDNMYVDISLRFLLEFKDHFNLNLELIQDDSPNAYIYDETIELSSMTSKWLKIATELKKQFPNNPYIKSIASATWGTIQQKNKLIYTREDINNKKLDVGLNYEHKYKIIDMVVKKGVEYYILVNTTKAYKYQLRLKPWVTAQARDDMGRLIMKHIDNVVRVQTDSLSFNKKIELNDPNYALESKTTGLIHWHNVNCYYNKTTGYKTKNY